MTRARTALLMLALLAVSYVVVDRLDPDDVARSTARVDRWETVTDEAAGFTVELPAPVLRGAGGRTIGPGVQVAVYGRQGGAMALEWFDYPESDPPLADPVAEAERRAVVDGGQFFLLTAEVGEGWQPADQDRLVRSFRLLPSA